MKPNTNIVFVNFFNVLIINIHKKTTHNNIDSQKKKELIVTKVKLYSTFFSFIGL